ncbi:MAG: hypothetical protein RIC36_14055 [Rhodospirillales bacterium]
MLFDEMGEQHLLNNGRIDGYEFLSFSVDVDLADFLVRNRGWVLVDIDQHRQVPLIIRFYTPNVETKALDSVSCIIAGLADFGTIGLQYWYGGWAEEQHVRIDSLLDRIGEILDRRDQSMVWKPTSFAEKAGGQLFSERIDRLAQIWRASRGVLNTEMLGWMGNAGLMHRTLMVELQDEKLIYRYFGAGFEALLGRKFCRERRNTVQDGSGSDYASKVVQHYYDVVAASQPYYDRITTSLPDRNREDDSPMHYRYFDYERGLFPCMSEDGKLIILGHTENTPRSLILA